MLLSNILSNSFKKRDFKLCVQFYKILNEKRDISSSRFTINLDPDIEKELDSGDIKHRKHPGVSKLPPIKLPSNIQEAIYRLVSSNDESNFLKRSFDMCKKLYSRSLPVESEEMQKKIFEAYIEIQCDDMPELLQKKKILDLKKHLVSNIGRWKPIDYDKVESLSYLAGRAAPNYASTYKVLTELKKRAPDFQPKTFFDFGSGIGSALWAANNIWSESLKEYFCVDSSPDMNDLSQDLLTIEGTEEMFIKPVTYRQFLPASSTLKFDLVVCAFSMLELSSMKERLQVIDTLWRKTNDILVVIEHGTFAGFRTVLDARDFLLHIENADIEEFAFRNRKGAYVVCPCPHESFCPKFNKFRDPCGVNVTYQTIFPKQRFVLKKDWISYVVLRKGRRPENDPRWPRIVMPVLKKARHAHCRLCCEDGKLHEVIVTKHRHGRHAYRSVTASHLGDLLPAKINPMNEVDFPEETFSGSYDFNCNDDENKT